MDDKKHDSHVYFLPYDGISPHFVLDLDYFHNYASSLDDWKPIHKYGEVQLYTQWRVRLPTCECVYTYGNQSMSSTSFDRDLENLTVLVSNIAGIDSQYYNSCNLNMYHDEKSHIIWHSDNEPLFRQNEFQREVDILSLSLGGSREIIFRRQYSDETYTQILKNGDLLFMGSRLQDHYQHRVPPYSREAGGDVLRFNFTWRRIKRHTKKCPLKAVS